MPDAKELKKILITAFAPLEEGGFVRRSARWTRAAAPPLQSIVVELQKSNYGAYYYVNVVVLPVEHESQRPISRRVEDRIAVDGHTVGELLGDADMPGDQRTGALRAWVRGHLLPLVDAVSTVEGLRTAVSDGSWLVEVDVRQRLDLPWPAGCEP